jgi:hypothetical protein
MSTLIVFAVHPSRAYAQITAGPNPAGMPTSVDLPNVQSGPTQFVLTPSSFGVIFNANAGPWDKIIHVDRSIPRGTEIMITESILNQGLTPWMDWHEEFPDHTTGTWVFLGMDSPTVTTGPLGMSILSMSGGSDGSLDLGFTGPVKNGDKINIIKNFTAGKDIPAGTTFTLREFPTTIPEPSSLVIACIGIVTILGYGWFRGRSQLKKLSLSTFTGCVLRRNEL